MIKYYEIFKNSINIHWKMLDNKVKYDLMALGLIKYHNSKVYIFGKEVLGYD